MTDILQTVAILVLLAHASWQARQAHTAKAHALARAKALHSKMLALHALQLGDAPPGRTALRAALARRSGT